VIRIRDMSALGLILAVHQFLYERSDGWIGHPMLGTPSEEIGALAAAGVGIDDYSEASDG
jgi:hypothetical protein